ncbi:putative bifunctional diguanylate cyclase/phosphodiesterase [Alteromonas mediterranea]|jgi:diguanylate cyclase (GGDEF)-like protein/PAS domain S-box-containing protein|uniref:Histidine kinase n=1 Tax=Alteromonas mediterranea TaxID=314275 RepID=A0AAC9F6L3_9ALTE|nr:bifunctional diguanylate cyclase/phosphodiesterase [Alteromonas mediterranea]AFV83975.1 sensory box protein [Alteromonas mediterranea DE1]AGP95991.1 sensory box protein [Alteromonas mediterranea UM7]AGQ00325.1 sensory box protein [Alteromonas mediterranea UM4b]AMJ77198.1 histidine kinase [Alteromonas mediterranea]AMJ81342.1 histidine kinase [Alteromonas mediterranea]|tara:strand:- start:4734 stop:6896 length:2163 start_codon:yes stop_codon:yes gene_type:complete
MADDTSSSTPSNDHAALLERRLKRERAAREQAEALLVEKMESLYETLKQSQNAQKDLELALWASQESFWSWKAQCDRMEIRSFSLHSESVSTWSGTLIQLLERVHEDDIEGLQFHWSMALHGKRDRIEFSFRLKLDEDFQWVRLRGRVLERGNAGEALHIVGTTKDITQQRKAEQSFHLMASAFASSREPMLVLSPDLVITECNDAFIQLIGAMVKDQWVGLDFNHIFITEKVDKAQLASDKQVRFESKIKTQSGEIRVVDISVALFETYQQTSYLIATMRDISDRKRNEARLRQLALHDELTGLSNRNFLRESITGLVESKKPFVLVFIDLDGFKAINDNAGHERGDIELQRVGAQLTAMFGPIGEVGRWGGDEFIAVLPSQTCEKIAEKSQQLIHHIEEDVVSVKSSELRLSASIGIADFPAHSDSIEGLIQCADAAMYRAKELGKGQAFIYEPGLYESMTQQVSMVNDLRRTVENHLLDFYIQGKYDLNGELKGGEVLCRWISGLHGVVSPAVFIPIAEEQKLDSAIGLQALEAACDYISIMESQQGESIPLSVNISANQMLDPNFPQQALKICMNNSVSPEYIELELTESVFIRDEKAALRALNTLKENGFRLSLDDFGSGFSSLSYLRSFQFEVVKVDKSLIQGIHLDSKANALFNGLIAMLKSLQIEVVAEGVELESYLPFMQQADIQLMQGFYFDKPMPYDQFLARHTSEPNR